MWKKFGERFPSLERKWMKTKRNCFPHSSISRKDRLQQQKEGGTIFVIEVKVKVIEIVEVEVIERVVVEVEVVMDLQNGLKGWKKLCS